MNEVEGNVEAEFDMDSAVSEIADGVFGSEGLSQAPAEVKEKEEEGEVEVEVEAPEELEAKEDEADPEESPEAPKIEPPRTWRKEAAEAFSSLPKVVQDEILKREDDIFKGIEQYKESAAFGQKMRNAVEKYLPALDRFSIPVEAQVAATMDAHFRLTFGSPEEKLQVVQQIIQDYNVDPARIVTEVGMVSPEVSQLQSQIRALQFQLNADAQRKEWDSRLEIERQIKEFSSDPANEHFEIVANDMASIIRGNPGVSLKEAYTKAIWVNPQTRELELAKQRAEAEAKVKAAAKARAEKVSRSTAANVKTSAKSGSAAAPLGTMDDTLSEAYARITGKGVE